MIRTLNTLFVTMCGLGKVPKIPGTFGSLATVILLYFFFHVLNLTSKVIFIGLASLTFPHILLEYLLEKNEKKS